MKVYQGLGDKSLKPGKRAVAIGIFDGVHRGHGKIIQAMMRDAKKFSASSMVVTFDPHPIKILAPKKYHPTILMSLTHRLRYFEQLGIREVLVIPFSRAFSQKTREFFLRKILVEKLGIVSLTVGHDFRFGKNAAGDEIYLKQESRTLGFRLNPVSALKYNNEIISSTRIRALVEAGDLSLAKQMLGRPVSVVGTVVHGRGRGKKVGFPTANLNPHHEALPAEGVYAAYGFVDGKELKGVIHIGKRPTFEDRKKSLEVHFLQFKKKIYGREIELVFVKRLRGIQKFESTAKLHEAIQHDIHSALAVL